MMYMVFCFLNVDAGCCYIDVGDGCLRQKCDKLEMLVTIFLSLTSSEISGTNMMASSLRCHQDPFTIFHVIFHDLNRIIFNQVP